MCFLSRFFNKKAMKRFLKIILLSIFAIIPVMVVGEIRKCGKLMNASVDTDFEEWKEDPMYV